MHHFWSPILNLAQDAAANSAAKALASKSVLEYIREGGTLSFVLIAVSFIAVALIIRNILMLRRARLAPPEVLAALEGELRENNLEGALAVCGSPANDSFIARVFGAALLRCS